MTFLNPLVLFGLIATAIPVLLHFLNLRKLRKIEFSTLSFLKELKQTKIRRLKLRQILLLILRTLIILFIVLAFARPAIRNSFLGAIGSNAHSTIIIILDDSFSMSARDTEGERLSRARQAALNITTLIKESDDATLLRISDLPNATIESPTHNINLIRTYINETKVSTVTRKIDDAIRLSIKILAGSSNANKEIYLITDNQKILYSTPNIAEPLPQLSDNCKLIVIPIGSEDIPNISIDSVEVTSTIFEQGKPVLIHTAIKNYNGNIVPNLLASVYLNGIRVNQKNLSIAAFNLVQNDFLVTPKKSGFNSGYIKIEDDAIAEDNIRYFSFFIPEIVRVLFISTTDADIRFPKTSLTSSSSLSDNNLFFIEPVNLNQINTTDFSRYDVLVMSNIKFLSSTQTDRIKEYISNGGGLIIFPGENTSIPEFNNIISKQLGIASIQNIGGSSEAPLNFTFDKIDFDHPIFEGLFEATKSSIKENKIESPSIAKSAFLIPSRKSSVIISMSNNSPFLIEDYLDQGKIYLFSVAPTLNWSDFPLKGIFAPLLHRLAQYAGSNQQRQYAFITGAQPHLNNRSVPKDSLQAATQSGYILRLPDGSQETINRSNSSIRSQQSISQTEFILRRMDQPGIYQINSGKTTTNQFAINTNSEESDLRIIDENELRKFYSRFNADPIIIENGEPSVVTNRILQSRFGTELWKHFIILALLLAIAEMIIARDSRKSISEFKVD